MAAKKHSPRFETVRRYYERGLWDESKVRRAVECGWITQAECDEILNGDDEDTED